MLRVKPLVIALMIAFPCGVSASPVELIGNAQLNSTTNLEFFTSSGCGDFDVVDRPTGSLGTVSASVSGCVGYGFFQGVASASITGDLSFVQVLLQGINRDMLMISPTDGTPFGEFLTMKFPIAVEGSVETAGDPSYGSATAEWTVGVSNSSLSGSAILGEPYFGSPIPTTGTLELTVRAGIPFPLQIDYMLELEADNDDPFSENSTYSASANFCCTIRWGGISSVVDSNGRSVAYTLTSESGTDWTQPLGPAPTAVPEPTSLTLLGTGVLALISKARRRKPKPAA